MRARLPLSRNFPRCSAALLLVALHVAALFLAAGCRRSERAVTADTSVSAIATVNTERISYDEFENEYQAFLVRWDSFIRNDPVRRQQAREIVLRQMMDDRLLDQEARRRSILVSDEELDARLQDLIAPMDRNELRQSAVAARTTLQQWLRAYQRRLVHQKLVRQEVIDKVRLSPAEMRDFYNRAPRKFQRPEQVKVRHLAVGSRDLFDRVMKAIERNEDFVQLVKRYSITPDRANDGELGYVQRGTLPPELERAVFESRRVGAISSPRKPVQTQIGFHIFRVEGYRAEGLRTFEEAQADIRAEMVLERQTEAYRRWLEGLRKAATIVIDHKLLTAEAG
jgi:parvulin-like peptidyl-prolyl isomerase